MPDKQTSFPQLVFEVMHNHRTFLVSYESESRQRNRLMSLVVEGLPIDTAEVRNYDPELYRQIKAAMQNNSDTYWSDEEERNKQPLSNILGGHFFNALKKVI